MSGRSRGVSCGIFLLSGALLAVGPCQPPSWRYLVTLAPPATLPTLPDGQALALTVDSYPAPVAAVGKVGPGGQAVDLFSFTQGTWSFTQRLAPRAGALGTFGVSVALSDSTLAVGAFFDDPLMINHGYVDVYANGSGGWTFQQSVTVASFTPPPNTGSTEFGFGRSLDLQDDDLVVGAGRFGGGYGRAFVFHRTGGTFTQVAELQEPIGQQRFDANFGDTVRISGNTIIVTRPDTPASTPPPKSGKVYVYVKSGGTWVEQQVLQAPGASSSYDGFGIAASLTDDTLAVRGPSTVWLFARSGGVWSLASSVAVGPADRNSISLSDEWLAVGEPQTAVGSETMAGQVRLFLTSGHTLSQHVVRTAPTPAAGDNFGARVVLRDGQMLVGAPGAQPSGATLDFINCP